MKTTALFPTLLAVVCCLLLAQEARAQGVSGYTCIDYDGSTNTVDSYSETDLDGDLVGDYSAMVSMTVVDQSSNTIASGSMTDTSNQGYAYVELLFSGAPDSTYTAVGAHKAVANLWSYYDDGCYYRSCIVYWDNFDFTSFESLGIYQPWYYYFLSPGFQQFGRSSPVIAMGSSYDSASVTITAPHPFNFHQTVGYDAGGGALYFNYAWNSSTGNLADLSNCKVGESVSYPGGNPYFPPNPPFRVSNQGIENPTVIDKPATAGAFPQGDLNSPTGFATPYRVASFTATQQFRYSCSNVFNGNYVNLKSPIKIVRSVSQNSDGSWKFTLTKSGVSAAINPLP